MFDKLERNKKRYEELQALLSDPEVTRDQKRYRELRQEQPATETSEETETPSVAEVAPLVPEDEMQSLRKRLQAAIDEENYEEAARLRDRIREIESA